MSPLMMSASVSSSPRSNVRSAISHPLRKISQHRRSIDTQAIALLMGDDLTGQPQCADQRSNSAKKLGVVRRLRYPLGPGDVLIQMPDIVLYQLSALDVAQPQDGGTLRQDQMLRLIA